MNHLQLVASSSALRGIARSIPASSHAGYGRRRILNGLALAVSDATALLLASVVGVLAGWPAGSPAVPEWTWWLPCIWIAGGSLVGLYPSWGMGTLEELRRVLRLAAFAFACVAATSFIDGAAPSPALAVSAGATLAILPVLRAQARRRLVADGSWGIPVVVYGAGREGERVVRHLMRERGLGLTPVAIVDDNPIRQGRIVEGFRVLGQPGDRVPSTEVAVVAQPDSDRRRVLADRLIRRYVRVILLDEELHAARFDGRTLDYDGLVGREVSVRLAARSARLLKRCTELLLIAVAMPVWIPLVGIIAGAIWLEDRHAPFARRIRVAANGRPFESIRFRTVVPDPGERLRACLLEDETLRREWTTRFRLGDDPRTTRVGHFLRRVGLEDLPQLFDVLRGRMALVGPRPLAPHRYDQLPEQDRYLLGYAAPGMTGLWKRYEGTEAGSTDAYYVRRWSIGLDAVLLLARWLDFATPAPSTLCLTSRAGRRA